MIFLSYLALFLLLFDLHFPYLNGLGSAPFAFIISAIVIVLGLNKSRGRINLVFNEFKSIILLYIVLFIYTCLRILFDGAEEPSYVGSSLRASVILASTLLYIVAFDTNKIFYRLLNVFFINAGIALFVGSFQEFQKYVDMFKPGGGIELIGWTPYRNAFLSGSGYFGIGAPFGLASVFFMIYMVVKKETDLWSVIKLLVIIIAAVFAARTVFICLFIALIYLIFIRRSVKAFWGSLVVGGIAIFVLNLPIFQTYHVWLFEMFETGLIESDTTKVLLEKHLQIPNNSITWFFGDAKYSMPDGKYYMGADIGYVRHWFFGGVFFMLAVAMIPFLLYLKNKENFFLMAIIPVCLLLHFKGVFIYNNPSFTPLLLLISHILYKRRFL